MNEIIDFNSSGTSYCEPGTTTMTVGGQPWDEQQLYDSRLPESQQGHDAITSLIVTSPQEECWRQVTIQQRPTISSKEYWAYLKIAPQILILLEVPEDVLERVSEYNTTISFSPSNQPETEERPWRGVFAVSHSRKTIFSKDVEIATSSLPRWQPQIIINRRILESEDE